MLASDEARLEDATIEIIEVEDVIASPTTFGARSAQAGEERHTLHISVLKQADAPTGF